MAFVDRSFHNLTVDKTTSLKIFKIAKLYNTSLQNNVYSMKIFGISL